MPRFLGAASRPANQCCLSIARAVNYCGGARRAALIGRLYIEHQGRSQRRCAVQCLSFFIAHRKFSRRLALPLLFAHALVMILSAQRLGGDTGVNKSWRGTVIRLSCRSA